MVEPRQGGESECWLTLILVVVAIDTVVLPHPILVATGDVLLVAVVALAAAVDCLLYTSPSPRDATLSRMPSSA